MTSMPRARQPLDLSTHGTVPFEIDISKSWRAATASLLLLVVCCASAVAADGDGTTTAPIKIYVDESRSLQLPLVLWKQLGPTDGYRQTRVMDLITYERLRQYDVMIIWNQVEDIAYSDEELSAVRRFVAEGGGLLILGTPDLDASERAPFRLRQRKFTDIKPIPANRYSLNQIAALFGTAITNAVRQDVPTFRGGAKATGPAEVDRLNFKQPLAVIRPPTTGSEVLMSWGDQPVAAALIAGNGRVIVCGADRLFLEYGAEAERKQGQTSAVIAQQKALLRSWTQWLAEHSPVRNKAAGDLPNSIPGRLHLQTDQLDVYCIPQLGDRAKTLVSNWQRVWRECEAHTGLTSPLELIGGASRGQKLQVYLRTAKTGGRSGGTSISIPGLNTDEWRMIGILSHEVGHKLLGGCNDSVSQAFAEWMNARGLAAAGYKKEAREKIDDHVAKFLKADPTHNALDVADHLTNIRQRRACEGKWIWILGQLQDKYGPDFIRKYVAALRQQVKLSGPAKKILSTGKRAHLTMADHVRAFSAAAGEDLAPWFRERGITVDDRQSDFADPQPSDD